MPSPAPTNHQPSRADTGDGRDDQATARKFRVSPGRISQTRRELETTWAEFQGEPECT